MFGQPKRFVEVHRESYAGGDLRILMDAETGVHYLCVVGMGPMSITPLLDDKGQPVISREE